MADFQELYDQIYAQLAAPTVSAYAPSKTQLASEIAAYLRPQYDQAIASRQNQTLENRAAIDTDAASRGMGRSTWVTDVKDRAMDAEASDIANLESNYQSALSQAVQEQFNQAMANKLAADQFNASAVASAKGTAYQLATSQYNKSSGTSGTKKSGDVAELLTEAQSKFGYLGNAINNIDSLSSKYTSEALAAAKQYLTDKYVAANTNYGYK